MDWRNPPADFSYILFEKEKSADQKLARFYYVGYLPTLIGPGIVRAYGCKGGKQRIPLPVLFNSLEEAWPKIRKLIRARLRGGYKVVSEGSEKIQIKT